MIVGSGYAHRPTAPVSAAEIAAMRAKPGLRAAIRRHAAERHAHYAQLSLIERWSISDMGRSALAGWAMVLHGRAELTVRALLASPPVTTGEVSRGRARLYLDRAVANGLIMPAGGETELGADTLLTLSAQFQRVAAGTLMDFARNACELAADGSAARLRDDVDALDELAAFVGDTLTDLRRHFPLDSPIRLFQDRDGGTRMLEALILRQPVDGERLMTSCEITHSALARAGFCSRMHAIRLLRDGEAQGLMTHEDQRLTIDPALSDEVEVYFASAFAAIHAAVAAMTRDR